ncbi:MAG TPA: ferrochelatase [Pyrinomonadaceae bacterium]|nr:ferrochelatase [Pyrinomonadaceae bacterium]
MQPFDALLVVSFGGPEGMDDVVPFLENVLRGRNVPRERLLQVAKHYEMFGGISPINQQNRQLIARLKEELAANGPRLPVYWGNRNWHPRLADTVAEMAADGIKHALAFVTSAYSSYSSCRQYLENIVAAREAVGSHAPKVDKLRAFYNHPLFIQANVANIRAAFEQVPESRRARAALVFTAHSIPQSMARNCDYEAQLKETSSLIAATLGHKTWALVYQSRSGPPTQPWLGPDICDYLEQLSAGTTSDVMLAPIGFVSDHMEIIYDLDTEARGRCETLGLTMFRASTVGTHPLFIKMIRELILERIDSSATRRFSGSRGPTSDVCGAECCLLA